MVLINAAGARNNGFKARRKNRGSSAQAKLRAAVGCGLLLTVSFLILFLFLNKSSGSSDSTGAAGSMLHHRHAVDATHPELHLSAREAHENTDFFDTIASDILHTLQCQTLLNAQTAPILRNGNYVFGIPPPPASSKEDEGEEESGEPQDEEDHQDDAFEEAETYRRRRLRRLGDWEGEEVGGGGGGQQDGYFDDDFYDYNNAAGRDGLVTAAHLFCLAAYPTQGQDAATQTMTTFWKDKIQCDNNNNQASLLDLWSTARTEITETDILLQTLEWATERSIVLASQELHIWAPPDDVGTEFMVNDINSAYDKTTMQKDSTTTEQDNNEFNNEEEQSNDKNPYLGIAGLQENLGPRKLYVDVGSGLGYTAMAVALLYPGTEIVSIEAAPTNWLMQQLNWRCNREKLLGWSSSKEQQLPRVLLAGVGPSTVTSQLQTFVWRPTATTSTRAWSLAAEKQNGGDSMMMDPANANTDNDLHLRVKLRPWHQVLAEADLLTQKRQKAMMIDVLNVDCEGCEYNLIPALEQAEYDNIRSIMGQVHWGYIPRPKLPSSERGAKTHERLCQHENFARTSIECCAFPDLSVKSSFSGEVLMLMEDDDDAAEDGGKQQQHFPPTKVTVKDLAGDLCNRFESWAQENYLRDIESDVGWFEISHP